MEHRSQKTSRVVSLLVAVLAIAPLGAAELSYEVRHNRALKDHTGVLTINEKGVGYQQVLPDGKRKKHPKKPPKLESVQFDYQEIEHPNVVLPARVRNPDYIRHPVPAELIVPERYGLEAP